MSASSLSLKDRLLISYEAVCQKNFWRPHHHLYFILSEMSQAYQEFLHPKKTFFWRKTPPQKKGVYLTGPVGRGKTFTMDLFFNTLNTPRKNRWHFSAFMPMVIEKISLQNPESKGTSLERFAEELATRYDVICLDEFQITEIGDASLLYKVFQALYARNVFCLVTANLAPHYLNTAQFPPGQLDAFINFLEQHWHILSFESISVDFRRSQEKLGHFSLLTCTENLEKEFFTLSETEGKKPFLLETPAHHCLYSQATNTTLLASFEELCHQPYGSQEYQCLTNHFQQIFLTNVPILDSTNRDKARRFITLIDCLYDNKVSLKMSALAEPDFLYQEETSAPLPFDRTISRLVQLLSSS